MSRNSKRKKRDPYSTSYERLSIYPTYKNPESDNKRRSPPVREGTTVKIRITGVDDEGRPIGLYSGYEIAVDESSEDLEPGETVRVKIKRVRGRKALGSIKKEEKD
ncbi:MAG: TRAM domain-containing protein [Desulfurococcales archaeon]|nr:TRAM domain-containing protein [Desulfurococcales archaeon]